jgi:hypothetical protein
MVNQQEAKVLPFKKPNSEGVSPVITQGITLQQVIETVTALGLPHMVRNFPDGQVYITAFFGRIPFAISGNHGGHWATGLDQVCTHLRIGTTFDDTANEDAATVLDDLNEWNCHTQVGRASKLDNGETMLEHTFLILGNAMEYASENLRAWLGCLEQFHDYLYQAA